ncbi:hypothetical protein [Streptomyces sp. NPDC046870]|uniref:terpene synthase family protein n=1 Tax=Streptomyces sp. NPDC046870 TaxID=3155135 RepID=UPI00345433E1
MPFDPSAENPLMERAAERMWAWAYGHGLVRDRAARERMERTRPELWAALCYTTCDPDTLALLTEWVYWGFALDDEFDEGGHDVPAARAAVGALAAVLHGGPPRTALEKAFADLLARSCPGRSAGWVPQFRYGPHRYVWTLYSQTADRDAGRVPTVAEFVDLRRDAIAMNLYFDLHEIDAGIAPASVPPFLAAQLLGAAAGLGLVAVCFDRPASAGEDEVTVPQQPAAPARSIDESALV